MARTISGSQSIGANATVNQLTNVNDSTFNPLQQTSRVSLYAFTTATGLTMRLTLGSDVHAENAQVPFGTGALSTRDHLVATGIALRGQKITAGSSNSTGGALTLQYQIVIEPL